MSVSILYAHLMQKRRKMAGIQQRDRVADPVSCLWEAAQRMHSDVDAAYNRLGAILHERADDDQAIGEAEAQANAMGRRYEQLCDQICNTEARTLEGVLAKLRCATRCIRDIMPNGKDAELACDIELRLVFAVERDVERLLSRARLKNPQGLCCCAR